MELGRKSLVRVTIFGGFLVNYHQIVYPRVFGFIWMNHIKIMFDFIWFGLFPQGFKYLILSLSKTHIQTELLCTYFDIYLVHNRESYFQFIIN